MNTQSVEARLIGVEIGGTYQNCQTTCDLTVGTSVTKNPVCKPNPTGSLAIPWESSTVDSLNWAITMSANVFLDSLEGVNNQADLLALMIAGNLNVTADFLTSAPLTLLEDYGHDFLYSGAAILATMKVNATASGPATYDVTITGNGPLTGGLVPKTT
jgi:hypothetical protein